MNRFERGANARSSITLPPVPLNRVVMTEMTSTTDGRSEEMDSCVSLEPLIASGRTSAPSYQHRHVSDGRPAPPLSRRSEELESDVVWVTERQA
jgi:hypothetical protein